MHAELRLKDHAKERKLAKGSKKGEGSITRAPQGQLQPCYGCKIQVRLALEDNKTTTRKMDTAGILRMPVPAVETVACSACNHCADMKSGKVASPLILVDYRCHAGEQLCATHATVVVACQQLEIRSPRARRLKTPRPRLLLQHACSPAYGPSMRHGSNSQGPGPKPCCRRRHWDQLPVCYASVPGQDLWHD